MSVTGFHAQHVAAKKRTFLKVLREKATVRFACKAASIHRWTAYRWRNEDEEFRAAWDAAIEDAVDVMENSVYERGLAGDSILSIFWLKGNRPQYRDRLTVDVKALHADIEERLQRLTQMNALPPEMAMLQPGRELEPPELRLLQVGKVEPRDSERDLD